MSRYRELIQPAIIDYVLRTGVRETPLLARLREETSSHPNARFQIPPEQGELFRVLVKMTGARRTIEVGVFTGYSALVVASALPADGKVIACELSEEYTSVARRYWAEAGVSGKIDLRIGPANETLDQLIAGGEAGKFDFAFIDADKAGYPRYYEQCLVLVRPGGVLLLDNMLRNGQVLDESNDDSEVAAIRALNLFIHRDSRVDAFLLPLADGITLAVKR